MGKRRDYGDGSISERKDGRFQASFYVHGKRKYLYGATRAEVKKKLRDAQRQLETTGKLAPNARLKVKDYLEYWLSVRKPPLISETTYETRIAYIHGRIIPNLGHIQLAKLTLDQIERFYSQMSAEKLEPGTIGQIHTILRAALNDAIKWDKLVANPCTGAKLPRIPKRDPHILTQEEAGHLVEAAKGTLLEAMIPLVLATAMRNGELRALHWEDIDFERNIIRVRRTLIKVAGQGQQEKVVKTEQSGRDIALAQFARDALKEQKAFLMAAQSQKGNWEDRGLVFPNGHGGYLWYSQAQGIFKRILRKAGLPTEMHFHDLRHNAATILLSIGVDLKIVQEILGHATIATTANIYGHVTTPMQKKAMEGMDQFLQGTKKPKL